jgi:ectoine hydroxylase
LTKHVIYERLTSIACDIEHEGDDVVQAKVLDELARAGVVFEKVSHNMPDQRERRIRMCLRTTMSHVHQFEVSGETPSPQQVAEVFWRDGIVALHGFYDPVDVAEVARELDETVAAQPNKSFGGGEDYAQRFETKVQVWSANDKPACRRVMENEILAQITEAICGPGFQDGWALGIFSTPYGCGQGWHQDSGSEDSGHYELNRILFPRDVMVEQGRLACVPGSHRRGRIPAGGNHEPLEGEHYFAPQANTLVLMHTRCFHRVEPNHTQIPRTQINSRARPKTAPEDVSNFAVFRTGTWNFRTSSPW